jgi:hypothetical protein
MLHGSRLTQFVNEYYYAVTCIMNKAFQIEIASKRISVLEKNLTQCSDLIDKYETRRNLSTDPSIRAEAKERITVLKDDVSSYMEEYSSTLLEFIQSTAQLLPPEQCEQVLDDFDKKLQLDSKAKLELCLPVIPFLLNFKTELGLDIHATLQRVNKFLTTLLFKV